jgi:hypothetical protein
MKKSTDYTLLALAIPVFLVTIMEVGCYNASVKQAIAPKRYLLEMGYNTKTKDLRNDLQRLDGYTIDALYVDGKDTVSVKGLTQAQYDSLNIAE